MYTTRQFLIDLQQKKTKFTQTLLELEKSILDFLNYLFQSRSAIESGSFDNKDFNMYLENFNYGLFLENLTQRFDDKVPSSYGNRVILGYYSIFLANLNEILSPDVQFVISQFLEWEKDDASRNHNKFIGNNLLF